MPGDVPHHEQQVAVGHRERVVPVPADLVAAAGRAVPHGDVDARRFGQLLVWRQERVLQPGGELVFRRGPWRQRVGLMPGDEDAVAERGGPQVGHLDRLRAAGEQPADLAGHVLASATGQHARGQAEQPPARAGVGGQQRLPRQVLRGPARRVHVPGAQVLDGEIGDRAVRAPDGAHDNSGLHDLVQQLKNARHPRYPRASQPPGEALLQILCEALPWT